MKKILQLMVVASLLAGSLQAREVSSFNRDWKFALGSAVDNRADFRSGSEYFNYLTKASHSPEGPYALNFRDRSRKEWIDVVLPHDWVVDLPFNGGASHSHGYKEVGLKYPEQSVGWYRKIFTIPAEDEGRHIELQFDGIFRNATVWVNGFYMGTEPSGYATQVYDITDYLNYGSENVVAVRADASLEEGWFYEGAGIYRNTWIIKSDPVHVDDFGTYVYVSEFSDGYGSAEVKIETDVRNSGLTPVDCVVRQTLKDAEGNTVLVSSDEKLSLRAKQTGKTSHTVRIQNPHLWDIDDTYLYTVVTDIISGGKVVDTYETVTGFRDIRFDKDQGFFLNGRNVELKGVNMHQDHAGVGAAIPDALQEYRLTRLKSFGCNAYRASHNPISPAMLEACDRLGFLVIDENRLMGINDEHQRLLERMIRRDRNHPAVILWSIGNEEWGIEGNVKGIRIASSMREMVHLIDPTRPVTAGISGGRELVKVLDVAGYNYIIQNGVEEQRRQFPDRKVVGTEETTGCGTRGVYFDDRKNGHMAALNRTDTTYVNMIERGWKFYHDTPWAGGLFYWTGFDYRGEPNPLSYPAVDSEFGLLDYCGFYKDEAWYLKAWWTDEPVLHLLPHWNLEGHEGETVDIWAYSNCDEVALWVNGKSMGRKPMPKDGHLSWKAEYQPGNIKAIGYRNGKKVAQEVVYTASEASRIVLSADRSVINADGKDLSVITVELRDRKGHFAATACEPIEISVEGPAHILGVGNGDPACHDPERPVELDCKSYRVVSFNGLAQILVQGNVEAGNVKVTCSSDGMQPSTIELLAE